MDWNFFGCNIGVVSCVDEEERVAMCRDNLTCAGIDVSRVHFGNFARKPGNNTIAENHMYLVRRAYAAGAEACLILESDVAFFADRLANRDACTDVMRMIRDTNKYDIFYLGQAAIGPIIHSSPFVVRTSYPLGLHAYVLSRSGMRQLLAHTPHEKHSVDNWIALNMTRKFAAFPSLAYQTVCHSVPNFLGGKYRGYRQCQNTLEWMWIILIYVLIALSGAGCVWLGVWLANKHRRNTIKSNGNQS